MELILKLFDEIWQLRTNETTFKKWYAISQLKCKLKQHLMNNTLSKLLLHNVITLFLYSENFALATLIYSRK